jgi:hypothetical protein
MDAARPARDPGAALLLAGARHRDRGVDGSQADRRAQHRPGGPSRTGERPSEHDEAWRPWTLLEGDDERWPRRPLRNPVSVKQ